MKLSLRWLFILVTLFAVLIWYSNPSSFKYGAISYSRASPNKVVTVGSVYTVYVRGFRPIYGPGVTWYTASNWDTLRGDIFAPFVLHIDWTNYHRGFVFVPAEGIHYEVTGQGWARPVTTYRWYYLDIFMVIVPGIVTMCMGVLVHRLWLDYRQVKQTLNNYEKESASLLRDMEYLIRS